MIIYTTKGDFEVHAIGMMRPKGMPNGSSCVRSNPKYYPHRNGWTEMEINDAPSEEIERTHKAAPHLFPLGLDDFRRALQVRGE